MGTAEVESALVLHDAVAEAAASDVVGDPRAVLAKADGAGVDVDGHPDDVAVGAADAVDAFGSGDDVGEKVAVGRGDGASLVFAMRAAVGVAVGHVEASVKTLR